MIKGKVERNYGIDLLRIVSMFMVVVLHVLGAGGILEATSDDFVKGNIAWFLECACYCAVNCYAIISGYVMVKSKVKFSNIIMLWLQVLFWNIIITLLFVGIGIESLSLKVLIKMFFPVMTGQYWYFTAYFLLFFMIPLLNAGISKLKKNEFEIILVVLFLILSLLPTLMAKDVFYTEKGYSTWWLMYLYIIGAYLSKYKVFKDLSWIKCFLMYILMIFITWGLKVGCNFITNRGININSFSFMLIEYTSPTVLFAGIFLVLGFSKLKVDKLISLIKFFSPISFGVYVIHSNPLISHIWDFKVLSNFNVIMMVIFVLVAAFLVYLVCSLLDYFRSLLFKKMKLNERVKNIVFENK